MIAVGGIWQPRELATTVVHLIGGSDANSTCFNSFGDDSVILHTIGRKEDFSVFAHGLEKALTITAITSSIGPALDPRRRERTRVPSSVHLASLHETFWSGDWKFSCKVFRTSGGCCNKTTWPRDR